MKLIRRTRRTASAELCEACGQVCTARCRAEAHRERTRTTTLHLPR